MAKRAFNPFTALARFGLLKGSIVMYSKGKRTINLIYAHVLIVKKIIENFTAKTSSKCKS